MKPRELVQFLDNLSRNSLWRHANGGQGVYFKDPDGGVAKSMTVPQRVAPAQDCVFARTTVSYTQQSLKFRPTAGRWMPDHQSAIAVYPIGLIVVAERTHSSIQRLEVIGGDHVELKYIAK